MIMRTKFNWYAITIAIVLICTIVWLITGEILSSVILAPLCVDGLLLIEICFMVWESGRKT